MHPTNRNSELALRIRARDLKAVVTVYFGDTKYDYSKNSIFISFSTIYTVIFRNIKHHADYLHLRESIFSFISDRVATKGAARLSDRSPQEPAN